MADAAGQNWQRSRRMLKSVNDMVENQLSTGVLKSGKLVSTFKKGKIKRNADSTIPMSISIMLLVRMQRLTQWIRSRRHFRSKEV